MPCADSGQGDTEDLISGRNRYLVLLKQELEGKRESSQLRGYNLRIGIQNLSHPKGEQT